MSTPTGPHDVSLPLDAQQRIAEVRARFDQAWRTLQRPRLEDFLQGNGNADEQGELLRALLEVEFFHRRQLTGDVALDEYLARFSKQADLVGEVFAAQTMAPTDPIVTLSHGAGPVGPDEVGPSAAGLPTFLGRYRVTGTLGRGSFGVVYRGRDDRLQREIAIKVPRLELIERMGGVEAYLKEARVVAALEHPNIVPVHDVDHTADGLCFVVFGFVEGSDLRTRLEQGPTYSPVESARLVACLARALQHAHQKGVYHRDLKPANILLDRSGKPHLTDFGLAQEQEDYGKGPLFAGTPAYMSPEQTRHESHRVDGRSDIFSLGVVLYELLAGQRPFQGTAAQILDRIAHGEARPLREQVPAVPAELERICMKAMARSLSERYTTTADLAIDLESWLNSDGTPPLDKASPARLSAIHPVLLVAVIAMVATLGYLFGKDLANLLRPAPPPASKTTPPRLPPTHVLPPKDR